MLAAALLVPGAALAQAPAPLAGKITSLIPVDSVVRQRKALNAVRNMPVYWGDVVQTARGGRVRVQLQDGSILNVGSQSALLITQHNPTAQQTDLQIVYGRVRADVVKIVTPGGHFEMRTNSAVAGVIGTDEYLEATDIYTTVIALGGGNVAVRSTDPRFPTPVVLGPGETTTVVVAHPPSPKRLATGQELQKAFAETEVSPVGLLSPGVIAPGQTAQIMLTGKGLVGTTAVTSNTPGIRVQISGPVTATQIPITVTVADNVAQGTYPLTVKHPRGSATALLIVSELSNLSAVGGGGGGGDLVPPTSQSFSVIQGTKFSLDASDTKTPTGTTVTASQWQITGTGIVPTAAGLSSNQSTFLVDTSLLPPGNFTIQLVVVNSRGQTATQQFPLSVSAGPQPADVIAQLATAYESLQPSQFLSNFDPQNFPDYAGFAESVQDSFLNKLQSVRVFQRPVNCTIIQQEDQAICQANFTVQFTLKSEPSEFLDANGNVVPAGTPGAVLGKPVETGTELPTIRFSRSNAGWKIVGYNAQVTCPGGGTTNGVNVGSCLLAIGSSATPSFQIGNLQLPTTDLFLGSTLSGSFTVTPLAGFNGSVTYTAQGQVGDQTVSVTFNPNPSSPSGTVNFTIAAPTVVPTGFSGAQTFTLAITGTSGTTTSSISQQLTLKGDFSLSTTPATSSSSPAAVPVGGTLNFSVGVVPGAGFAGNVAIDFPNLPTGFSVSPATGTVAAGSTGNFTLAVSGTAPVGPQQFTVRGTFGTTLVRTTTVFVNVTAPFTLTVTPATTSGSPAQLSQGGNPLSLMVQATPAGSFVEGPAVTIDFPSLPTGFTVTPASGSSSGSPVTFSLQAGATAALGPAPITVRGTLAGAAITATVFVNVSSAQFTVAVTSPSTNVESPAQVFLSSTLPMTVQVSAGANSGFSGSVAIDFPNLPAGFSVDPPTGSLAPGTPATFTLLISINTAPLGASHIIVRGTFGGTAESATVFVNVNSPFALLVSPTTTSTSRAPVGLGTTLNLSVQAVPAPQLGFCFSGTGPVAISFSNLPTGFTAAGGSVTACGSAVNFSVQIAASVPLGPAQFNVVGTLGTAVVSSTVFVNVSNLFMLSVSPTTAISAIPTGSANFTVTLTPVPGSGFNSPVTIGFAGVPAFLHPAGPTSLAPNTPTTYTASVDATAPLGQASFQVTGTFGGMVQTATVTVNVITPSTISVTPATSSGSPAPVAPDSTLNLTVQVVAVPNSGFTGSVTIALSNPPAGFSANPISVAAGSSGTLAVQIASSVPLGAAQLNVNGTFNNAVQTSPVFVNVVFPFTFSPTPATTSTSPAQVAQGGTLDLTVQVVPVAGFSGTGTISFANLPAGISVNPTSNNIGSGLTTFTVSVASTAATGPTQFTVVGSFNGNQTTATVFLNVVAPAGFVLQVAPATTAGSPVNVIPTGTLNVQVQVVPSNGFTGTVTISVPSDTEFSASPIQVAAGSSGTLAVQVVLLSSGGLGPQQFVVQGTSGSLTQTSTVFVNVLFPFTLNVTPATTQSSPVNAAQGSTFNVNVQVAPVLGFSGSAAVSLSGPSFFGFPSRSTVQAGSSANFQVQVAANAPLGPTTIIVNGAISGTTTATQFSVFVNLTSPPLFQIQQLTSNPAPLILASGSSVVLPITIVATDPAFTSAVTLTFGVLPVGVTVSPTTATLLPGSTQNFTFSFTAQNNPSSNFGIADVTVTGASGSSGSVTTRVVLDLVASSIAPFNLFAHPDTDTTNLQISLPANTVAPFTVGASPANYNQPITITFGQLPTGVTINPTTITFTPSTTNGSLDAFDLRADPNVAVAGTYKIPINGVSNGVTATTTLGLVVRGSFALSVAPSSTSPSSPLVLTPGSATPTNITVTATSLNQFSGTVTVTLTVPFNNTQISINPVFNGTNSVSVTLTVPAGGQAQQIFALTALPNATPTAVQAASATGFSANGPPLNSVTGPYLAIGGPSFNLNPPSVSLTLLAGGGDNNTPNVTAQVVPLAGFSSPVVFTVSPNNPSTIEIDPTQETVQPGGQAQFFVHARGAAVPGNYALTISAASGSVMQTLTINATVQGQITLNVTDAVTGGAPGTQTNPIPLAPSMSHNFNVAVAGNDNFSGPVNLQVTTGDKNLTASFGTAGNTTTVQVPTGGGPVTVGLTLTTSSTGLSFNFEQIAVQASSPAGLSSTSPGQTIFITGTTTGFILGCDRGDGAVTNCSAFPLTPLTLNINQPGSSGTLQLRADSVGNLKDPIKVVASGLPAGVTMTPSQLILTPQNALAGTDVPVTFTAQGSSAVSGPFSFTLTGTDTVNTSIPPSSTTVQVTLKGSIQLTTVATTTPTSPIMIATGATQALDVNVISNGFAGTVTLSAISNAPFPVTITPPTGPITVTAGGTTKATFNVTIPPGTPASAPFAITFDASATRNTYFVPGQTTVPLYLAVGPGSFAMQIQGLGATLAQPVPIQLGTPFSPLGTTQAMITPLGGFNGTITLDVVGLPGGITASFQAPSSPFAFSNKKGGTVIRAADYGSSNGPFSVPITFTTSSGVPAGVVQATLTATSGSITESVPLVLLVIPQVNLSVTPSSSENATLLIAPGGATKIQVAVTSTPSFAGAVDLTLRADAGLTVTPPSAHVTVGSSVSLNVSVASTVAPGTRLGLTITGSINGIPVGGAVALFSVGSGTFQLSVNPATATSPSTPLAVQPGGPAAPVNVTVTPVGSFTGSVSITASFFNDGGFLSTPNTTQTVSAGQTATFPVSAAANAPGVTAAMFFEATSGGLKSDVQIFVSTLQGSFSLVPLDNFAGFAISNLVNSSSNPLTVDIGSGNPALFTVLVNRQSGFSGSVRLSATSLPGGVTLSPNNVDVPPGSGFLATTTNGSAQSFSLQANFGATAGDQQITIAGTSGTLAPVSTTVFVRIRGVYFLNLSMGGNSTAPLAIPPGTSQPLQVSAVPVTNFAQPVTITPDTSSLPAGVTVTPASATASPGSPARFTLTAASTAPSGGELTLNFASSTPFFDNTFAPFPTATLFYTVGAARTFNFSLAPQAGTVLGVLIGDTNGNNEFATLTPVGGFSGNVSLIVNNLPPGVTANPAATIVSLAGAPVTVPINFKVDSTVQPQFTQAVTVTATAVANAFVASKSGTLARVPGVGTDPALVVPISLNLLGDYRLQVLAPASTGGGSGRSPNEPATLSPGTSTQFPIQLAPLDNFGNNTVNLTTSGSLPAGVTASITPTATGTIPGTLTVNVASTTPTSAAFPITVTATSSLAFTNPQTVTIFCQIVTPGTFQLTLAPPSSPVPVVIGSNQFVNFNLTFNGTGSLASPTSLTFQPEAGSVPAGVTITPSIGQATIQNNIGGATLTFQVKADPPATAGMVPFQIQATLATTPPVTATATVQLDLQGSYSLVLTPTNGPNQSAVVAPGKSVTLTVSVVPQNGFSGTVTLRNNCSFCSAFLPGVTLTNTLTASPSTPGQIVISASANAAPAAVQQIPFTSSAPDTSSRPTLPVFLAVGPPGISVNGSFTTPTTPAGVMINGGPSIVPVQVVSLGGFSGNVIVTVGALPAGLSVSPQSASGTVRPQEGPNQQGIPFAFQANQQAAQGLVSVPITVTSGSTTTSGFVYLYVISNLALVQNPATSFQAPLNLTPGAPTGQTVTISLQSQGGANTGQIPLTISGVPAGITVTPNPNPPVISAGRSVSLSIVAGPAAPPGLQSFTVQTSFAGVITQTQVFVFVGAGDFSLQVMPTSSPSNPIIVNPPTGANGTPLTVTVTPINGFTGSVSLSPTSPLPRGVGIIVTTGTVQAGQSTTLTIDATTAVGPTPLTITLGGTTTIGGIQVSHTTTLYVLVNPPSFTLSKTAAPTINLQQGNLQNVPFTVTVTGQNGFIGPVTIAFANVPQGVNINPPSATVQASASGTAVTFNLFADQTAVVGSAAPVSVIGTSGNQTVTFVQGIGIVVPTSGIFVTTDPPTSAASPLLLQPDSSLLSFLNINVFAEGRFVGTVNFQATQVPPGVTATLVPATADLTASSMMQVLQLQLRTTTGLAPFGPVQMNVVSSTSGVIGGTGVFVALQGTSAVAKLHPGGSLTMPQIQTVQPDSGMAGTYTTVTIRGQSLSGINGVLADSSQISGKLEAGATNQQLQVTVFAGPHAQAGRHSVLLISPNGSVPIAFTVTSAGRAGLDTDCGALSRLRVRIPTGVCRPGLQNNKNAQGPANSSTAVAVSGVVPAQLQPGTTMDGRLIGSNLRGVTAVRMSGQGIRAQVIQATDSAVQVRFVVDAAALPGSHIVTVDAGGQTTTAVVDVAAVASSPLTRRLVPTKTAQSLSTPDQQVRVAEPPSAVVLRLSDLNMSPANPKRHDTITFEVRVSNEGSTRAENVPISFSIGGTRIQANQQVTLDPGQSQAFAFQWQARRSGRFEPQVAIDPDNRVAGLDRVQTTATFPSFELSDAPWPASPAAQLPAMRQRAQLSVTLGGCSGLRLDSGNEMSCGAADLELHLSSTGGPLSFDAENVRNLGMVSLDQLSAAPAGALGHSETVVAGSTYLVVSRNQTFVVHVLQIRGLESARNAPPPALRGPRLGGFGGPPRLGFDMGPGHVTLSLEWKQVRIQR